MKLKREGSMSGTESDQGQELKKKRQRVSKACDACRTKKQKCNGTMPCEQCLAKDYQCTFGACNREKAKIHPQGYMEYVETLNHMMRDAFVAQYLWQEKNHPNTLKRKAERRNGKLYVHDILAALGHPLSAPETVQHEFDEFRSYLWSKGAINTDSQGKPVDVKDDHPPPPSEVEDDGQSARSPSVPVPHRGSLPELANPPPLFHSKSDTPPLAVSTPESFAENFDDLFSQPYVGPKSTGMNPMINGNGLGDDISMFNMPSDTYAPDNLDNQTGFFSEWDRALNMNPSTPQQTQPYQTQYQSSQYTQQLSRAQMQSMLLAQDQQRPNSQAYPNRTSSGHRFQASLNNSSWFQSN